MRYLFVILILALAAPVTAQDLPALFRVTDVAANDRLNIRDAPGVHGAILGSLAPDATGVEIVARSDDGRWGLLRWAEGTGWASLRYLAPIGGSAWDSGAQALTCSGTEPFWTLRLFLPDNRAEFLSPDTSFDLRNDAPVLPATRFPRTLAIPLHDAREGMAVIRAGLCSDGMSDRLYGLEAQLYWRGDTQGLSGCCALGD